MTILCTCRSVYSQVYLIYLQVLVQGLFRVGASFILDLFRVYLGLVHGFFKACLGCAYGFFRVGSRVIEGQNMYIQITIILWMHMHAHAYF